MARYATPAGFIGPLGVLSGLAGFSVFRELGSQTEDQLVMVRFRTLERPTKVSNFEQNFSGK